MSASFSMNHPHKIADEFECFLFIRSLPRGRLQYLKGFFMKFRHCDETKTIYEHSNEDGSMLSIQETEIFLLEIASIRKLTYLRDWVRKKWENFWRPHWNPAQVQKNQISRRTHNIHTHESILKWGEKTHQIDVRYSTAGFFCLLNCFVFLFVVKGRKNGATCLPIRYVRSFVTRFSNDESLTRRRHLN